MIMKKSNIILITVIVVILAYFGGFMAISGSFNGIPFTQLDYDSVLFEFVGDEDTASCFGRLEGKYYFDGTNKIYNTRTECLSLNTDPNNPIARWSNSKEYCIVKASYDTYPVLCDNSYCEWTYNNVTTTFEELEIQDNRGNYKLLFKYDEVSCLALEGNQIQPFCAVTVAKTEDECTNIMVPNFDDDDPIVPGGMGDNILNKLQEIIYNIWTTIAGLLGL
jgi:hypothetical protein